MSGEVIRRQVWYRSFYFRIGFTFVVFVVLTIIAQSLVGEYIARAGNPFPNRSPNNLAAIAAADVGAAMAQLPGIDLQQFLEREYGRVRFTFFVVLKDGHVASNANAVLAQDLRRSVVALLQGGDVASAIIEERAPVVMAPVQVAGELRAMVVMPPPADSRPLIREVARLLSWPGAIILIVGTALTAGVIFAPARRRLKALAAAATRLGSGDLSARAPETGGDEIALVAGAFNVMARELAARDEALRTSDRLRRQMLADVSHELKTPLTSMRGYLETLRMSDLSLDPETRDRYFGTVERETLRLDRIVKDLLDLARLEHGVGSLERRVFATGRLFDHVVGRHEQEAAARQINLDVTVDRAADQICADPDRLEQVVENLVSNALRHTPDGGRVELRASATDDQVILSVADTGAGIPPEHVPHVFDRFYKVDAARANGAGGSGLGLSITKAIVDRHHGTIEVTSRPGETRFTVRLPKQ